MIIHSTPRFIIYFGDIQDGLSAKQYQKALATQSIAAAPFQQLKQYLGLRSLIFLRQEHGTNGLVITPKIVSTLYPFECRGDFLLSNIRAGLGILTGDCLPVIIYDYFQHCIAIVHAGWKGSIQQVILKAIDTMHKEHTSQLEHLRIIFGPSAKVCCYQVSTDFIHQLTDCSFIDQVIIRRKHSYYFDLPMFNRLQLEKFGIKKDAISLDYNSCTICHDTFFSRRRQGDKAGRQMTVVSLR